MKIWFVAYHKPLLLKRKNLQNIKILKIAFYNKKMMKYKNYVKIYNNKKNQLRNMSNNY